MKKFIIFLLVLCVFFACKINSSNDDSEEIIETSEITNFNYQINHTDIRLTWDDPTADYVEYMMLRIDYEDIRVEMGIEEYVISNIEYLPDGSIYKFITISAMGSDNETYRQESLNIDYQFNYVDSYENNNRQDDSMNFNFDSSELLSIYPIDDIDWFIFPVEEYTVYEINTVFFGKINFPYVRASLYNSIDEIDLNYAFTFSPYDYLRFDSYTNENLFLCIKILGHVGEYSFNINKKRIEPDDYEDNNSFSLAANVLISEPIYATIHNEDDTDYYQIYFQENVQYFVSSLITNTDNFGLYTSLRVYNLDGTIAVDTTGSSFYWTTPNEGEYVIEVTGNGAENLLSIGEYILTHETGSFISPISEPNDNFQDSIELSLGIEQSHTLDSFLDEDWFFFNMEGDVDYLFELDSIESTNIYLEIHFYNSDEVDIRNHSAFIGRSSGCGWSMGCIVSCPTTGKYYAQVFSKNSNGCLGEYTIVFSEY